MKIVTIVGARPQFIKAAVLSRVIRNDYANEIQEVLVHTGQHYDDNMSKVFFEELDIPEPKYNLEISGGHHGEMTGRMLEAIERVLLEELPDWVLIYGDTNSTLAGALAAVKLHLPVAHVEAGLRSFNLLMPEEINRIIADRVSTLLFCPTQTAVHNLEAEGVVSGVHLVGDVMYDASLFYRDIASQRSRIIEVLGLSQRSYVLATCHRAENTNEPTRIFGIIDALQLIAKDIPVVLPLHPRTKLLLERYGFEDKLSKLIVLDPLPFLDMVQLEQFAYAIVTDSGGVQKEAYFYGVPCLTTRDETEWVETVDSSWNQLVGADSARIINAYSALKRPLLHPKLYGNGNAAELVISALLGTKTVGSN